MPGFHRLPVHGAPARHGVRAELCPGAGRSFVHAGPCRRSRILSALPACAPPRAVHAVGRRAPGCEPPRALRRSPVLLCVSDGRLPTIVNPAFRGPGHSVHGPGSVIMETPRNELLTCNASEPPIGIEPMTYALREACEPAAHALAAPIAPVIALTALAALGLSGYPVHEPVHAGGRRRSIIVDSRPHRVLTVDYHRAGPGRLNVSVPIATQMRFRGLGRPSTRRGGRT